MRLTSCQPACSHPLVLGGGGGVLVLLVVALLALVSIHDRSKDLDDVDRQLGKVAASSCSTRMLVCSVPPADHDGRKNTCRAIDWKRGGDGSHASLRRATAAGGTEEWAAVAGLTSQDNGTAVEQQPHEVFTVRVCPSFARNEVAVRVLHHHLTHQQQAATRGRSGEAFIEALLDGPERRLQRLSLVDSSSSSSSSKKACEYGTVVPIGKAGEYSLEVSVVHTGESEGLEPYRNYLLWQDRQTFPEGYGRAGEKGRWVRRAGSLNSNSNETEAVGYRCPVDGEGVAAYEWVEGSTGPAAAAAVELAEEAQGCVRRLAPRAKIVFMGDSFSRQAFNGLARVLGLDEMMAIKAHKSMKTSQDFEVQGMELGFQWAPFGETPESRERLKTLLKKEQAHVIYNFGAHPICKGPLNRTLALFDSWLEFVTKKVVADDDNAKRRLTWLGTHPRPVAGFHRHHPDHATALRSLNRDAALDAHVRQRMAQEGIQVLDVFDIVNPFRDCTVDGTHHAGGVAEAVAKHRVVPWLCEAAAGASG